MSFISGIVVYILIWWVVLFAVLPWGVGTEENPEPGRASGAPPFPRLGLKFLITTAIAFIVWLVVYALIEVDIIDFRAIAETMTKDDLR